MNHRDEVIAIFATGGPLSIELLDKLMTYAHAQCMENVNVVKDVVNRYTKTNLWMLALLSLLFAINKSYELVRKLGYSQKVYQSVDQIV
jgi:hypothetical protein